MKLLRKTFNKFYDWIKPAVFKVTASNPEHAHELFAFCCKTLYTLHLDEMVLDHEANHHSLPFELSNAAGFNKNGEIPPQVLRYLGFDRAVIGTLTCDAWKGNPKPRVWRYPESESLVNWMGLPGIGAEAVAEKISNYRQSNVPLTINLMSTPQKSGDAVLRDLEGTILATRDLPNVDRYELNISCPNTHSNLGAYDARIENLNMLEQMLKVMESYVYSQQQIYVKVSPDSTEADVKDTLQTLQKYRFDGIVTANTTTNHDRDYIAVSPQVEGKQVGGASGEAVYKNSLFTQSNYYFRGKEHKMGFKIIACGGINSIQKIEDRRELGASEIQIFTPLIFKGPGLLREIREHYWK